MPAADASPASVIGVVGAGTMGAGIAQLAARAGARTLLHDPLADALQRGAQRAGTGLAEEAAKGRLGAEEATRPPPALSEWTPWTRWPRASW